MRLGGLVSLLIICGCGSSTVVAGGSGGSSGGGSGGSGGSGGTGGTGATGGGSAGTGGSGGAAGSGTDPCTDAAKTVYVLSNDRTFSAFDPLTKTFRDIGVLNCPAMPGAVPFSMAVARDANAYVIYTSGELFKVATSNLQCTPTAFVASNDYRVFGMGFSTDAPGGTTDTLFIAGGPSPMPTAKLGRLDVASYAAAHLADLTGWPELTGTGDAQLWGFFPDLGSPPFVARLDKASGAYLTKYPAMELAGEANAYAFAFWGGSFWIFLQRQNDPGTQVWEMKAGTGALSQALPTAPHTIVGAGVSTCAPITIN